MRTLIRRISPLRRWLYPSEEEWENSEDGDSSDSSSEDEDLFPGDEMYVEEQEIHGESLFNAEVDLLHVVTGTI